MRTFRKLLSVEPARRKLLLEAFFYLGWARILKALPFSRIAPSLGEQMAETAYSRDVENERLLLHISRAILTVSRHTWWESKCLVMAIAGMKMLQRRGIASTLYLGTAKDPSGKMIAHAWLRSGSLILTGAKGMELFTVVAKFAKKVSAVPESQRSTETV